MLTNEVVLKIFEEYLAEDQALEVVPVSYTHLDVYKRQLSWNS